MHNLLKGILKELKQPSIDIHYNNINVTVWIKHHSKGELFKTTEVTEEEALSKALAFVHTLKD